MHIIYHIYIVNYICINFIFKSFHNVQYKHTFTTFKKILMLKKASSCRYLSTTQMQIQHELFQTVRCDQWPLCDQQQTLLKGHESLSLSCQASLTSWCKIHEVKLKCRTRVFELMERHSREYCNHSPCQK